MRTPRIAVLAAALVTGGIAACSDSPVGAPPPEPAAAASPASVAPSPPAPAVTEASADGQGFGLLTGLRLARHDGFDRIVFEFASAVPGYRISYVDVPVTSDPAGKPVSLAGTAALQITLLGASAYAAVGDPVPAYRGPDRVPGGGAVRVTEIVALGDFERVMVWAAGVTGRTGFRVATLAGPPRLVVDVVHS